MAVCDLRGNHPIEDLPADPRLVAESADPPPARVEIRIGACLHVQGSVIAIERANKIWIAPIASGATELLDPRMFIGRNRLRRELPAYPLRLLGENDPKSEG